MQLWTSYVNEILIFVIFAVSLNVLMGYAGQVSVAHAAFGALGGYTLAYLVLQHHWTFLPAAAAGVGIAFGGGLFVGVPALRLTTEWLILLTLAVQTIIVSVANASPTFGGSYGLENVVGLKVLGHQLNQPTALLPLFAVLAAVVFLVCRRMGESPYGRVLRSIREDERASRSLGKNVFAYKLAVFGITSAMAGVAGVLLTVQNQLASPSLFGFDQSTAIIAMVIFGGMGNLVGSVIGAALLVLSAPFLERVVNLGASTASLWRLTIYGVILVIVMMVRPQGLLPEGESYSRRLLGLVRRGGRRAAERPVALAPVGMATTLIGGSGQEAPPVVTAAPAVPAPAADIRPARGEAVLEVRGLTKRFGGIVAVEDLDFQLTSGTITALVGPNGAGKTTVFNLLTGAIRPDRGEVRLHGRDVTNMAPDRVAKLGMVRSFQDVRVFPRLTALQNVMLGVQDQAGEHLGPLFFNPAGTARAERRTRERAQEWLSFVGMDRMASVPAAALGFGQQKLVALARILATEAEVVLLDEPASGIDQQWVDAMLGLIEHLRPQGRTVCIVEHNLAVVGRLADHTYFMELGRITAQGSFAELTSERRLAEAYFGTA